MEGLTVLSKVVDENEKEEDENDNERGEDEVKCKQMDTSSTRSPCCFVLDSRQREMPTAGQSLRVEATASSQTQMSRADVGEHPSSPSTAKELHKPSGAQTEEERSDVCDSPHRASTLCAVSTQSVSSLARHLVAELESWRMRTGAGCAVGVQDDCVK